MAKIEITKTELVWPGKYNEDGMRKEVPRVSLPFQVIGGKAGIKLKEICWTMGRYDVVVMTEAPDDETISRAMLSLGSLGNVRTETLRAFSAKEMDKLLKGLP